MTGRNNSSLIDDLLSHAAQASGDQHNLLAKTVNDPLLTEYLVQQIDWLERITEGLQRLEASSLFP